MEAKMERKIGVVGNTRENSFVVGTEGTNHKI